MQLNNDQARLRCHLPHSTAFRPDFEKALQCYDVPDLPRSDNDLEQFYRRVKTLERCITGQKRSDTFVVRVGGFAMYTAAASDVPERELLHQLATVLAEAWQGERARLHAMQERQTKMWRFHLHPTAYLAELEARWAQLADSR